MTKEESFLVLGLGRTGLSVVHWLDTQGQKADVFDTRRDPPFLNSMNAIRGARRVNQTQIKQLTYARAFISPGFPSSHDLIQTLKRSGTQIVNDIVIFRELCKKPVFAITGSNGKSSVVSMMYHALGRQGVNAGLGGNIGKPVLEFLEQPEHQCYCLELSSFQLESVGDALLPDVACVLNVNADHMDRYADFNSYKRAKLAIYKGAKARVANGDDTHSLPEDGQVDMLFSLHRTGPNIIGKNEDAIVFHGRKLMATYDLKVVGQHNVANVMASLATLHLAGYPASDMAEHLALYKSLPHRFELVARRHGVCYINDSKATNVGATMAALASCRDMHQNRLILIAGGDAKGIDLTELLLQISKQVNYLVLIGKDARIFAKAVKGSVPTIQAETMEQSVAICSDYAKSGDIVLLSPACSSLDMFSSFEARGMEFSRLVREL